MASDDLTVPTPDETPVNPPTKPTEATIADSLPVLPTEEVLPGEGGDVNIVEAEMIEAEITEVEFTEVEFTEATVTEMPVAEVPVTERPIAERPAAEATANEITADEITADEVVVAEAVVAEVVVAEAVVAEAVAVAKMAVHEAKTDQTEVNLQPAALLQDIATLEAQISHLQTAIGDLEERRDRLQTEIAESQDYFAQFIQSSLGDLERRKQTLQLSIDQLERRQERIREEMRSSFAGSSQEIAMRVQSFKDYLVGSLQDLVTAADRLDLVRSQPTVAQPETSPTPPASEAIGDPEFAEPLYEKQTEKIRQVISLFRNQPDYYGPTWKLRRTFEAAPAER
ncbi:MAG: DUF3086 domain-containing protein, partial [Synechococcales bacterium]|nr:DUF3086 domain-containing protein [Synechococcales bacterium]